MQIVDHNYFSAAFEVALLINVETMMWWIYQNLLLSYKFVYSYQRSSLSANVPRTAWKA